MLKYAMLIGVMFFSLNVNAQIDDGETTSLDENAMQQLFENIEPTINRQNIKTVREWKQKGREFKQQDCNKKRTSCVKHAITGGVNNPFIEAARSSFCKTLRKLCGEDWK